MHKFKVLYKEHNLKFKFDAGTSRGVLKTKNTYYISIVENGVLLGLGEAAPLVGLSSDDPMHINEMLDNSCRHLEELLNTNQRGDSILNFISETFPAVRFGFEMALKDYLGGGKRIYFDSDFVNGAQAIPINGLIWMSDKADMLRQIKEKLDAGYKCIKLKIGAIDFDEECNLLAYIRQQFGPSDITLRVDANGAFRLEDALNKLNRLSEYDLHSIEQPIAVGNAEFMKKLCEQSPLAIALDEELIGVYGEDKRALLTEIRPQYIILKPTLLGGFGPTDEWVELAEEMGIGWWITSALESNVGLNAIAQYTAQSHYKSFQGLGTGQLFHNNIPSPLIIEKGNLFYSQNMRWDLSLINS